MLTTRPSSMENRQPYNATHRRPAENRMGVICYVNSQLPKPTQNLHGAYGWSTADNNGSYAVAY